MKYEYKVGDYWLPSAGLMHPYKVLHVHTEGLTTYVTCLQLSNNPRVFTWEQMLDGPAFAGTPELISKVSHPNWKWLPDRTWREVK